MGIDYRVRAISQPPKHHFFGYYDMRPWSPSGRRHLALEADFMDRPPTMDDVAGVCVIDLDDGNRLDRVSETRAWNFQQGAMLHWADEETVLFNDRVEDRFVCVACEAASGSRRVLGPAIAAFSDDGRWGATLNFARIAVTRPGYGYEGLPDVFAADNAPSGDGVGLLDPATGEHRLLVSMADLAELQPRELGYGSEKVWFNHAIFNPSGGRLAFLVRWPWGGPKWGTQMWTVGRDGGEPTRCLDGPKVSHYDWLDDSTLVAWAGVDGVDAMFLVDALGRSSPEPVFTDTIARDGHISYSHDRRWVVCDTYPDAGGRRELFRVDCESGARESLATLHSPMIPGLHEIRCDFHPSIRGDDDAIAFDGMHEGTRQRYLMELE